MSNPTFRSGPISFEAGQKLEPFTLVKIDGGKAVPASATGAVFGAVTEKADPVNTAKPNAIAIHYGPAAVKLTATGKAEDIKAGDAVYAAVGGKVAKTGTVKVGVAAADGAGGKVLTILNLLPVSA